VESAGKNQQIGIDKVEKTTYNSRTTTRRERSEKMSEREKKIMESISEALPKMSEFDKGYLLGSAERMVSEKEKAKKEESDKKAG
jgi:hypothetical protein